MEFLKQFMRRKAYKLAYAGVEQIGLDGVPVSFIFFGEIPFPTQEYLSIKSEKNEVS
mgnify:CR=1 FL=1